MVSRFDGRKDTRYSDEQGSNKDRGGVLESREARMERDRLTPAQIKEGIEFIRNVPIDIPIEEQRKLYHQQFGDSPIPKEIIEGVVNGSDTRVGFNMVLLSQLAMVRGAEMLPWIEPLLRSDDPRAYGNAAIGLLYIDEARGIKQIERLYELFAWTASLDCGFSSHFMVEHLREVGSAACLEAVERLEALLRHIGYVRYGFDED